MSTTADRSLLPGPQTMTDSPRGAPRIHRVVAPVCLLVVSIFTTASTGALLMQNFRRGQPPLVNEGDLFPLHWIW